MEFENVGKVNYHGYIPTYKIYIQHARTHIRTHARSHTHIELHNMLVVFLQENFLLYLLKGLFGK